MATARTLHPFTPVMLGTMTMGHQADEEHSHAQLDEFVKLGGVWIDTAEAYPVPNKIETGGETEFIIGRWIAKNKHLRSKIAIATKVAGPTPVGNQLKLREMVLTGQVPIEHDPQDLTPAQIKRALEASLKRLQTDYVDLYQLHWPSRPIALWGSVIFNEKLAKGEYGMRPAGVAPNRDGVPVEEIVTCMGELLKSGKILSWGLSNETAFGITRFCEVAKRLGVPLPVTVQNDFSLLDRTFESQTLEAASYYNMKLLGYGPLCGGFLTGKYLEETDLSKKLKTEWRHIKYPAFQARYYAERAVAATKKYSAIAKAHNLTLVELALGFCATRYYMGSVIIGANTVEQMTEDFYAVMNAPKKITEEVMAEVNKIQNERPNPNVSYI